jgi:hypothetical protein
LDEITLDTPLLMTIHKILIIAVDENTTGFHVMKISMLQQFRIIGA